MQHVISSHAAPAPSIVSEEFSNSIDDGESQYLQYDFPVDEGFTIEVEVTAGMLTMYGSFSIRNPNAITSDFTATAGDENFQYFVSPELYNRSVYIGPSDDRRKRQSGNDPQLFLALVGIEEINTFSLNTTFGDVSDHAGKCICQCYTTILFTPFLCSHC